MDIPTPLNPEQPANSNTAYSRLKLLLKRANLPYDLRRMFATNALERGMDVKTLSTIIGHTSSATTLNIYAHVTSGMQRQAVAKIDPGIGKTKAKESAPAAESSTTMTDFQPTWKRRRRWGTGAFSQSKSGRWTGHVQSHGRMGDRKHEASTLTQTMNVKGCWQP